MSEVIAQGDDEVEAVSTHWPGRCRTWRLGGHEVSVMDILQSTRMNVEKKNCSAPLCRLTKRKGPNVSPLLLWIPLKEHFLYKFLLAAATLLRRPKAYFLVSAPPRGRRIDQLLLFSSSEKRMGNWKQISHVRTFALHRPNEWRNLLPQARGP